MPVPQIAAVITNFRHGQYLAEALDSVRSQTLPPTEVIIVDDASGPDEERYLTPLARDTQVLRLPRNRGPGGARQAGTESTSAPLIAYLDGDDLWTPTKLEEQTAHLLADPHASASHTGTTVFHADGREKTFVDVKPPILGLELQLRRNQVAPPTVLIHRHALETVGGWRSSRAIVEDWDLFIRMVIEGHRIIGLRRPLTRVRRVGHSHISGAGLAHVRRLVRTIDAHSSTIASQLGVAMIRELTVSKLLDHRHRCSLPDKVRLLAAALLVQSGVPAALWRQLLGLRVATGEGTAIEE